MAFKTATVSVNGDVYHLRELSAGAVECVEETQSEYRQALTMLALSLCDESGVPLFEPEPETVPNALKHVRVLPASLIRDHLLPAATELNGGGEGLDNARGN